MDATIFSNKGMYRITFKCIKNFVIADIVRPCGRRIPRASSRVIKCRILLNSLQIPRTSYDIGIAFKICNGCRVIQKLVPATVCKPNEVSKIALQNLI